MLKNLFKYEFKWMLGKIVFAWIVVLSVAVLHCINLLFIESFSDTIAKSSVLSTMTLMSSGMLSFLFSVSIGLSLTFCYIMAAVRFYRNIYSSEGYFTLCTPIDFKSHIFCKFMVAFICALLTLVVDGIAYFIAFAFNRDLVTTIFKAFANLLNSPESFLFAVEIAIGGIALLSDAILKMYLAVSFGQCFKNKVLGAILFYFIISFVLEIAFSIIAGIYIAVVFIRGAVTSSAVIHLTLWLAIIAISGVAIGSYAIVLNRLKTKLNLE